MSVLNVWQIDSFEGGKGSRAAYLQNIGNEFSENSGCYVTVTSITATAARENLKSGNVPDLISYGAGTHGIESYIVGKTPYFCWCNGGYCVLTTTEGADFSDISAENTVINAGTDNLAEVCALFCGLNGADVEKPTGAYVKLINGKYKYLLGTQRDIYRLKTRGVAFAVKPVTEFNDLYQNISITSKNKAKIAQNFIAFLLKKRETVNKLGLITDGVKLYDDEMSVMEGLTYNYTLKATVSENTKTEINSAFNDGDIKKLKPLFK
ncbi:MAG: hypothetical protein K2K60_05365 [Clostridia bacterium]|nr:hypothetical protein [Clostridia bacterium]